MEQKSKTIFKKYIDRMLTNCREKGAASIDDARAHIFAACNVSVTGHILSAIHIIIYVNEILNPRQ